MLLLLLIAEAPLVVFTSVLAFQNQRLRAHNALAQSASAQQASLSDALRSIRVAASLAEAAGYLPTTLLNGSADCAAVLRTLVATNTKIGEAVIAAPDGRTLCSAAKAPEDATLGNRSSVAPLVAAPSTLTVVASSIVVGRRLDVGGKPAALVAITVRDTRDKRSGSAGASDPFPPALWLRWKGAWLPIGHHDTASLPPDTLQLQAAHAHPLRLCTTDGRSFLYSAEPLPSEYGDPTALLVAASDIRAAASSTRSGTLWLMAGVAAIFLAELVLVVGGVGLVVSLPLRRFNGAVRRWRQHGTFDASIQASDPLEVRELKEMFREAAQSLGDREAELQSSIAQQELLMQEIHHRVKNNLQIIASLLNLQASRIKLPEAQAEFQSARDRVRALATLHRHLYADGALHMINLRAFFSELCSQLFQGLNELEGERITVEVDAPEIEISSDQAVPVALIVTETVGNAIKYAFPNGRRGKIRLKFQVEPDNRATLSISDDGVGVGELAEGSNGPEGLGLQLVRGFARQLGSTLVVSRVEGTCYRIDMTLQRHRTYQPKPGGGPRAAASP